MKKWVKNLYRLYLAAFAVILVLMVCQLYITTTGEGLEYLLRDVDRIMENFYQKENFGPAVMLVWPLNCMIGLFFDSFKKILLFGILIIHAFVLWGEKSVEQREFLATLPVKKHDRKIAVIIMDTVLVFSAVAIAAAVCGIYIGNVYAKHNLRIPWLAGSVCGLSITTVCYMMALLGVIHCIESLVVRGDMKVIAALACLVMMHVSVENIFMVAMYDKKSIFHGIYGYMNLCTAGGNYYSAGLGYGEYDWVHKPVDILLEYKGVSCQVPGVESETFRLVAFSDITSYISCALSYLLIGFVLLLLAVYLVKRQELSRSGFYFHGGTVLTGLLLGITFFSYGIMFSYALWHHILLMIAAVIIFVGFVYIVDKRTQRLA